MCTWRQLMYVHKAATSVCAHGGNSCMCTCVVHLHAHVLVSKYAKVRRYVHTCTAFLACACAKLDEHAIAITSVFITRIAQDKCL